MKFQFSFQSISQSPWTQAQLRALLSQLLSAMPPRILKSKSQIEFEVVFHFVSLAKMTRLNFQLRGRRKATDVLSLEYFPGLVASLDSKRQLIPQNSETLLLGEIFLCPAYLKKQAKSLGNSYRSESLYMLIHGFLHVLGFDHEKGQEDARKMLRLQNQLLKKLLPVKDAAKFLAVK